MIFHIPAGKHYARPWRFGIFWGKDSFAWTVQFTESCRYDLKSVDQYDINKLCGIGYLPYHHKHSARFGWSYQLETGKIELHAYCYVKGVRIMKAIGLCEIGKIYRIELRTSSEAYYFACDEMDGYYYRTNGEAFIKHDRKRKLGYRLPVYFGGNQVAPHAMKIQLKKV